MENVQEYWKTEEGLDTFIDGDSFCAFSVQDDEFFIGHLYVGDRKTSYGFFKKIKEYAREKGCKFLSGNLDLNEYNAEEFTSKVLVHLANNYKIIGVTNNRITVIYEL